MGQIFSPSPHWGLIHSWNGFLGYFYLYSPCTKQSVASAPPQTCDNIWTTRPSQAPQEAPRRCQGAPQAPWWGGGLSCGAPSPIIWTAAADRRMPLTCLCRFYSSINVCFRFQDKNGQKILFSQENVTPYMTYKGWGRYETRWKTGFHPRRNFQSCDAASRWIYGGDEKGKNKAAAW